MKTLKNISKAFLIILAISLTACTEDTNMDEIVDNTEINSPSPQGGGTNGEEDKPGGG